MNIKLVPQRREDTLEIQKTGTILTINGKAFDFTQMSEGSTLPMSAVACEWLVDDVHMENGAITLTFLLPLPMNYSPEQAFPDDLIDVPDGAVRLPQPLQQTETVENPEI